VLVQARRDKAAARKLMRKLLKKHGTAPTEWVTDKYRVYGLVLKELGTRPQSHVTGKRSNNRANASCKGSSRPDRRSGSSPFTPPPTTSSASPVTSPPLARIGPSEPRRSPRGGRRLESVHDPGRNRPQHASRRQPDNPLGSISPLFNSAIGSDRGRARPDYVSPGRSKRFSSQSHRAKRGRTPARSANKRAWLSSSVTESARPFVRFLCASRARAQL
jgi:hypothetical protein